MAKADDGAPLPGLMPNRLPEGAPTPDFDATAVAKALLRTTRAGALATIDRYTGHPFGSLVNVATDIDGSPLILISRLSTTPPIWKTTDARRSCWHRLAAATHWPIHA